MTTLQEEKLNNNIRWSCMEPDEAWIDFRESARYDMSEAASRYGRCSWMSLLNWQIYSRKFKAESPLT